MPLYEYICRECDARFEVLQRIGDGAASLRCPECGGSELGKQYSTFATGSGRDAGRAAGDAGCGAPACGTGFA